MFHTVSRALLLVFVVSGLSFVSGCKSDCEKGLANYKTLYKKKKEKDPSDKRIAKFTEWCDKATKEQQSCVAGAPDYKALGECSKKGEKKEDKK